MVIDIENADADIKYLSLNYNRLETPKYKATKNLKYPVRKVNFKEAYDYDKDSFLLLCYLNQILNIFNLEYAMGRNATKSKDIIELEGHIFTGREFWNKVNDLTNHHKDLEAE